jgi:hypothetical protein
MHCFSHPAVPSAALQATCADTNVNTQEPDVFQCPPGQIPDRQNALVSPPTVDACCTVSRHAAATQNGQNSVEQGKVELPFMRSCGALPKRLYRTVGGHQLYDMLKTSYALLMFCQH